MRRFWRLFFTFIFFTCLLWCQPVFSAGPPEDCPDCDKKEQKEQKKLTLPEVLVTAFHGGSVTISPTKTVIDIKKFDKAAPVDRVEDVLQQMVGIDVKRSSSVDPQQMIMMRGFDDSRFTVAIDGRPINAPTAGQDTFVDWSSLTTGDIEKIEIIRGASSARYESSQGGIINLITKKGRSEGDSMKPNINVKTSYSSFDTQTYNIAVGGSLHNASVPNLGYNFTYGYKTSDGYLLNNNWWGDNYSLKLNYELPAKGNISGSYRYSFLHLGYPVVNDPNIPFMNANPADNADVIAARAAYNHNYPKVVDSADSLRRGRLLSYPGGENWKDKRGSHLDFHYDQPIGNTTLMLTAFKTDSSENSWAYQRKNPLSDDLVQTYEGTNLPSTSPMKYLRDGRTEEQYGGMIDYRMDLWDNNTLTVGYSQRRMEVAASDLKSTPNVDEARDDLWRIQGVYFEDMLAVTGKLTLNTGLRFVHTRESTYPYIDPPAAPGKVAYRHLVKEEIWLPKFTATYRFTPDMEVFVSANRDFHYPGC